MSPILQIVPANPLYGHQGFTIEGYWPTRFTAVCTTFLAKPEKRTLKGDFMHEAAVVNYLMTNFPHVETMNSYGYDMFFYRDERKLPFATLIASDYEHDNLSNLGRPGVFRLNIGISKKTFRALFGPVKLDMDSYDFTALDVIMPHPHYAQYHFICVLSPSEATFAQIRPLLTEAYETAVRRYNRQNK